MEFRSPSFRLQFEAADDRETLNLILDYAARYLLNDGGAEKDARALQAGAAIRSGQYTRANFETIVYWKLEAFLYLKPARNLDRNEDREIADALRLAVNAGTPRGDFCPLWPHRSARAGSVCRADSNLSREVHCH